MFLQAKHGGGSVRALVGADTFKYGAAVMQCVRKHMHLGFVPGYEFAVKPDEFRRLHGLPLFLCPSGRTVMRVHAGHAGGKNY